MTPSSAISISLPHELLDWLDRERGNRSRGALIREALGLLRLRIAVEESGPLVLETSSPIEDPPTSVVVPPGATLDLINIAVTGADDDSVVMQVKRVAPIEDSPPDMKFRYREPAPAKTEHFSVLENTKTETKNVEVEAIAQGSSELTAEATLEQHLQLLGEQGV